MHIILILNFTFWIKILVCKDDHLHLKLQSGSSATHQVLGIFQTQAADMHNHLIHPAETSTHMHSQIQK